MSMLSTARPSRTPRLAKGILIGVLILALSGAAYERAKAREDRRRFPQVGRSIDIGGRFLNIYCSGTGNTTVVLITGGGLPGYSWVLVQPEVARATRACWYDRAGLGWSDSGPETQSSFSHASDLHRLLQAADVSAPYVLVGHSVGGFVARAFYRLYSSDVAGIVLVEASHEDYDSKIHVGNASCPRCPRRFFLYLARALAAVGVYRLFTSEADPRPAGIKPEDWETIVSLQRQSKTIVSGLQEDARENEKQMRTAGGLGNVPLVVLTGGRTFANSDRNDANEYAQAQQAWFELQSELAKLSSRGRQVVVPDSGHMMPYKAPNAVIRAILEVVAQVHQTS